MIDDTSFRKFAVLSLSLFLAFNGSIALDYINIRIPLVREIFGFLFLTFIPGYTTLRILGIQKIDRVEAFLYAVGLSLFYVMIIGFFMNVVYPLIGIKKPITLKPLLVTLNVSYLLLLCWAYLIGKNNSINSKKIKSFLNSPVLALSLLPVLAIGGAYIFNITGNSLLIMITFFAIALVPMGILLKGKEQYLTYIIWILSISLLYASDFGFSWNYIWGCDINGEYYLSHLVRINGYWNYVMRCAFSAYNSVLSVVMLNPIYSILLEIDQIMFFKTFYPLIFSLVPVGLYKVYSNFMSKKESFLAVFFFISLSTFFTEMLQLARQQIAELYLMLLILLIFTKNLNENVKSILLLIFGFGLIVSHYGTAWLFLISLVIAWFVYSILYSRERKRYLLHQKYIITFVVLTILYYLTISNSSVFNTVIRIGNIVLSSIQELFTPKAQGFLLIVKQSSTLHEIRKYIYLVTQGIIGIGILWLLFNYRKIKINKEFVSLAFVWFAYDVAGVAVPYFSNALNASRLYHLTLFFLSPFEVIGWFALLGMLKKIVKVRVTKTVALKSLAIFLAIYLIFNSGVIYKLTSDQPYYGYLGKEVSWPRWSKSEVVSGLWMKEHKEEGYRLYADADMIYLFLGLLGQHPSKHMLLINSEGDIVQPKKTLRNYYLFLGSWNIKSKKLKVIVVPLGRGQTEELSIETSEIFNILSQSNKIYSSQNAQYFFRN